MQHGCRHHSVHRVEAGNEKSFDATWCYMTHLRFCSSYTTRASRPHEGMHDHSAFASSPSTFAFFFAFLFSRRGFVRSSLNSASSNDFSDLTSSGLYHTGGEVIIAGPPGRSAIVKWNAATKVFTGVKLRIST